MKTWFPRRIYRMRMKNSWFNLSSRCLNVDLGTATAAISETWPSAFAISRNKEGRYCLLSSVWGVISECAEAPSPEGDEIFFNKSCSPRALFYCWMIFWFQTLSEWCPDVVTSSKVTLECVQLMGVRPRWSNATRLPCLNRRLQRLPGAMQDQQVPFASTTSQDRQYQHFKRSAWCRKFLWFLLPGLAHPNFIDYHDVTQPDKEKWWASKYIRGQIANWAQIHMPFGLTETAIPGQSNLNGNSLNIQHRSLESQ